MVRTLDIVVSISAILSVLGILLYLLVYNSDVILMEAFVWLSEAISFLGLMVAFHLAASRALAYRARYEFLRLEALATLIVAFIAMGMTGLVVYKTLGTWTVKPTPILLSLYPLGSAAVSFILERRVHEIFHKIEVHLVSIKTVAQKLGLDVVFEAAGGIAIILSNLTHNILAEKLVVLATAAYVYYGLAGIVYESIMYLIGAGPSSVVEKTRQDVEKLVRNKFGRKPSRLRVETFGTFSEVEVWLEAPPHMTLETAHRISIGLAREIVQKVPEVIRALVILFPWSKPMRVREPVLRGFVAARSRRPRIATSSTKPAIARRGRRRTKQNQQQKPQVIARLARQPQQAGIHTSKDEATSSTSKEQGTPETSSLS